MIKSLSLILMALLFHTTWGQKFDMGKVSVKELEEKSHPTDTSASAAVLYMKGKTSYLFKQRTTIISHDKEMRIKIYKKEGLDYATYDIPYYVGYENLVPEYVEVSDAVTYNLVNGKIEKTKLGNDGKITIKVNERYNKLTLTMPNVRVGSVIEFKYTLKSENIYKWPNFQLQMDIPVNYVQYKTEVPLRYKYKVIANGILPITSSSKVSETTQTFLNEHNQSDIISYKMLDSKHEMTGVPALKDEGFIDNVDNYRSSIDHELELTRRDGEEDQIFSKTWEDVVKTIYKSDYFGKQLAERGYFEEELRKVLANNPANKDRVQLIFDFVQSAMNFNNKGGITTDKGLKKAFAERTGNVAEINLLLVAMLNASGILASPVLVSTVGNGIAAFPNQYAFDYVIASVEKDGKMILLDAANKYSSPGIIPEYAINWTGRRVNIDGSSEEIKLLPASASRTNAVIMAQLDAGGNVTGKVRVTYTDHHALRFRQKYADMVQDGYLEMLENKYAASNISNYSRENEKENALPLTESYDFSSNNLVDIIGGKIYIRPMLFYAFTENPFKSEQRLLPVYFGVPGSAKYNITLKLPDGYEVESLPASISIGTGEGVATFRFNTQSAPGSIQAIVSWDTNRQLVSAEFYPIIRDFYRKITEKQAEKIVLKKI